MKTAGPCGKFTIRRLGSRVYTPENRGWSRGLRHHSSCCCSNFSSSTKEDGEMNESMAEILRRFLAGRSGLSSFGRPWVVEPPQTETKDHLSSVSSRSTAGLFGGHTKVGTGGGASSIWISSINFSRSATVLELMAGSLAGRGRAAGVGVAREIWLLENGPRKPEAVEGREGEL